jgi:hypothetical protein
MTHTVSKALLTAAVVASLALAFATRAIAEEKTITGEGSCGKSHETVIKAQEGDKTVTYHLAENDVAKKFHEKVCATPAKVKATGEVKEVDGKLQLTATKIEVVKG